MKGDKPLLGVKALVMGLGLHGGGVATAKWLHKQGAIVTATDKRSKELLAPSLALLKGLSITFTLGEHRKEDFLTNDLIVVNPGVPRESEYLALAKKAGKRIENDTSLFFRYDAHTKIAVTGTRGKSTTTLYIAELLKKKFPDIAPSGNTPKNALLREYIRIKNKDLPVVAELSSWQLEYLPTAKTAPKIAVITNIFPDHLNRYRDISDYADAKASIFAYQQQDDALILNGDNKWTAYFLSKKPKGQVYLVSKKPLKGKNKGLFVHQGKLFFREDGVNRTLFPITKFLTEHGSHNLENMMQAVLAALLYIPSLKISEKDILRLPTPSMRQESVFKKGNTQVINDSCATSPDGTIAAIARFTGLGQKQSRLLLIVGGTDKTLEYAALAKEIKTKVTPEDVFMLAGSGTTKLQAALKNFRPETFETLDECVKQAATRAKNTKGKVTVLFSPGAASFEKFLHEFDRGHKFNSLVKKYFK